MNEISGRLSTSPAHPVLPNEGYLKSSFLEHLRCMGRLDSNSILASEFALGGAARRIDLAIWNGEFIGIEFKSKFDSLRRVALQLEAYSKCFDRIIFVVDQKHASKVVAILPPPIELWVVDTTGSLIMISAAGVVRSQTVEGLANLCSLADLRRLSAAGNPGEPRAGRRSLLARGLKIEDVYEAAVKRFKKTFAESSRQFWDDVGNQKISQQALPHLSRFSKDRTRRAVLEEAEQVFWRDWTRPKSDGHAESAETQL